MFALTDLFPSPGARRSSPVELRPRPHLRRSAARRRRAGADRLAQGGGLRRGGARIECDRPGEGFGGTVASEAGGRRWPRKCAPAPTRCTSWSTTPASRGASRSKAFRGRLGSGDERGPPAATPQETPRQPRRRCQAGGEPPRSPARGPSPESDIGQGGRLFKVAPPPASTASQLVVAHAACTLAVCLLQKPSLRLAIQLQLGVKLWPMACHLSHRRWRLLGWLAVDTSGGHHPCWTWRVADWRWLLLFVILDGLGLELYVHFLLLHLVYRRSHRRHCKC